MFKPDTLTTLITRTGGNIADGLFEELDQRYSEPGRHYHNRDHIAGCLQLLNTYAHLAEHSDHIALAIWFHDAIYDTHSVDNEEQSAALAKTWLTKCGLTPETISHVSDMVLATTYHEASDPDTRLMVDIDLCILGAPEHIFDAYNQNIRREYHWVPSSTYIEKRIEVLQSFLDRPRIYQNQNIIDQYEHPARNNLSRALKALQAE